MGVVCGYDLDCYCDTPGCGNMAEFGDVNYVLTFKQAKRSGWIFRDNETKCYCPNCAAKGLHNKSKKTTRKPRQLESPMPDRLRQHFAENGYTTMTLSEIEQYQKEKQS